MLQLEGVIRSRRQDFERRQEAAMKLIAKRLEAMEAELGNQTESSASATAANEEPIFLESEDAFLEALAQELTQPSFLKKHLRVHGVMVRGLFHVLYASAWGFLLLLLWEGYELFKRWASLPVRESLENIEHKLRYYPRQLRWLASEVMGLHEVRQAQEVLSDSVQSIVTQASTLVPSARRAEEQRQADEARLAKQLEEQEIRKRELRSVWRLLV